MKHIILEREQAKDGTIEAIKEGSTNILSGVKIDDPADIENILNTNGIALEKRKE